VEPVAGSTGTLLPPKGYLERLREICDAHGILLVFDEVITGFGRLGENFAGQKFGVTPDIMTMAKALTNGSIPMGGVAVKDEIYETVTDKAAPGAIEFFHGYTYSGHPAACAAGIAMQDIIAEEGLVGFNGLHVKFTGDNGILAPMFIAERSHVDEIIEKFRTTLDTHSA